jgi:hypothetical protein
VAAAAESNFSASTSSISSKSTSTEQPPPPPTTHPNQQTVFYSGRQHHLGGTGRKNVGSGCNRGKSVAKLTLDKDNIAHVLNFNYMYDAAIGQGIGLASGNWTG